MKIYVDVDGTVMETNGNDYENSKPISANINKINKLYDDGHFIVYWSARGRRSQKDHFDLTLTQLISFGAKFNMLDLKTKPDFDLLIDDKAININSL